MRNTSANTCLGSRACPPSPHSQTARPLMGTPPRTATQPIIHHRRLPTRAPTPRTDDTTPLTRPHSFIHAHLLARAAPDRATCLNGEQVRGWPILDRDVRRGGSRSGCPLDLGVAR